MLDSRDKAIEVLNDIIVRIGDRGSTDVTRPSWVDVMRRLTGDLAQARRMTAHDRRAGLHRLEQRDAEAFIKTWKQQAEGAAQ